MNDDLGDRMKLYELAEAGQWACIECWNQWEAKEPQP